MRRKLGKIWLIVLLAGFATYALAGFLLVPRAIKYWIENPSEAPPACRLRVQGVYVNPFTFLVSLKNVTLFGAENKQYLSISQADTYLWTVDKFRHREAGYDLQIKDLNLTDTVTGETVLAARTSFAEGLVLDPPCGQIMMATARLHTPVVQLSLDTEDRLRLPACVSADAVHVFGGRGSIADEMRLPPVRLNVADIEADVVRRDDSSGTTLAIDSGGRIGRSGRITVVGQLTSRGSPAADSIEVNAFQLPLVQLSPYFARALGREVETGVGDLSLRYENDSKTLRIGGRISIDGLRLGKAHTEEHDATLSLDLAVALLTDNSNQIDVSIPLHRIDLLPEADVADILIERVTAYIRNLSESPFDALARLVGAPDISLADLDFSPGAAELTPATAEKIVLLAQALEQRPLLKIQVSPAYDPVADRDAIAAQQVRTHIALATSSVAKDRVAQVHPDYRDPKVRAILDEFASARLTEEQRLAISNAVDESDYYQSAYTALVDNEPISETVLRRLARFRATSIVNSLANNGIDRKRLLVGSAIDNTAAGQGFVSVRLELETVGAERRN